MKKNRKHNDYRSLELRVVTNGENIKALFALVLLSMGIAVVLYFLVIIV